MLQNGASISLGYHGAAFVLVNDCIVIVLSVWLSVELVRWSKDIMASALMCIAIIV